MKVIDRDGDFNFVLLLAVPGIFALVIMVIELFRHPEIIFTLETLAGLGIMTALLLPIGHILREQAREDRFRAWLLQHHAELYSGGASYHGITLAADSQIHRYTYMFSLVVVRVTAPGRPLIVGLDDIRRCRRGYNVFTFLFGWWFITGPIFTPLTIYRNFKGPQPISIAEYMHHMGKRGPSIAAGSLP